MSNFGGNLEEGIGGTYRFSLEYHGEAGEMVDIQDMGDARGVSNAGSGGNAVGKDLHRDTAGNRGTFGGVETNL